jgi:glycosyltransferase involved in cell wall biosynthesis
MGKKQDLGTVMECARLAKLGNRAFRFVLMGDGSQRIALEALARELELQNLEFLPVQPQETFPNYLFAADVLLLNQAVSVSDMALPSKLTAYMAAGRPIVAAVDLGSETARELQVSGASLVVEPGKPHQLLEALDRLAADVNLQQQLGTNGEIYANTVLSRTSALLLLRDFVQLASGAEEVSTTYESESRRQSL